MSYDERLASRVRKELAGRGDVAEKKMFGGLCFMVGGAMCCGVLKDDLIVRVGAVHHDEARALPHTRLFDFSGRPARGMVYVSPAGTGSDAALAGWVERAVAGAREAPARPPKARRPPRPATKRSPRAGQQ